MTFILNYVIVILLVIEFTKIINNNNIKRNKMGTEIMEIKNVRGYIGEDGFIYLNLEDVAKGLGFTEVANSGNITVRWRTLRKYLKDLKVIATSCDGKGNENLPEFIKENIFYKLCMKANNEIALSFQDKVADEILPQIRKTGTYGISEEDKLLLDIIGSEDKVSRALALNNYQNKFVIPLKENAEYTTNVLKSESLLTVSQIAKDLGMGAIRLNKLLESLDIQYKKGGKWYIKVKYQDKGYAQYDTTLISDNKTVHNLKWTEKGKKFIIEILDREYGIKLNTLRLEN